MLKFRDRVPLSVREQDQVFYGACELSPFLNLTCRGVNSYNLGIVIMIVSDLGIEFAEKFPPTDVV